jgi:uncharacterized metal-binding protein
MSDRCCASLKQALLFACAGGSNVGQISNDAAVALEKSGVGRLYCLAGIGGHVEGMVKTAQSAPCTVAIDGCASACARKTLEHVGIEPTIHVTVTELGIEKEHTYEYPEEDVQRVVDAVLHGTEATPVAEPSAAASCCGAAETEDTSSCCES